MRSIFSLLSGSGSDERAAEPAPYEAHPYVRETEAGVFGVFVESELMGIYPDRDGAQSHCQQLRAEAAEDAADTDD